MNIKENAIPALRFPDFHDLWKERTLDEITDTFKSGIGITSMDISIKGDYPVYGGNGLRGFTNRFTHDGSYVLIGRQGALCGNITKVYGKNFISEHAIAVNSNEYSNNEWLAQKLDLLNLNRLSESSAQPGLSVGKLLKIKILQPSLPEQQKVASFLTSIDDKIQQLTKKKNLLEQYKKGVMQQIFNQEIRFKDDNGNDYPEWVERRLGEIALNKSSNVAANKIENNYGKYIIYGASGILKKVDFYNEESEYISIVKDGAGVGRLFLCEPKTSVLATLQMIKPKKEIELRFLYYSLMQIDFKKYVTGSTIPHIYFSDYSKEFLQIPSKKEQQKIANFIKSIDDEINLVNTQLEKTQQFKKGLLQQMFV